MTDPLVVEVAIFADYFQFYIEDEARHTIRPTELWNEQSVADLVATSEGFIAIGTVRNMTVPVSIEIYPTVPTNTYLSKLFEDADHVTESSIQVMSDNLVVRGCTDYYPTALRIPISPGTYHVRIFYNVLNSLSEDGLDGNDNYRVILWSGHRIESSVLKRKKTE